MKRWKLIDRPESVKFKMNIDACHAVPVFEFNKMPVVAQKKFLEIKRFICGVLGETRCFAFGSWTKGTHNDNSDYDIFVYSSPTINEKSIIARKDFGVKVDIRYILPGNLVLNNCIEIK